MVLRVAENPSMHLSFDLRPIFQDCDLQDLCKFLGSMRLFCGVTGFRQGWRAISDFGAVCVDFRRIRVGQWKYGFRNCCSSGEWEHDG